MASVVLTDHAWPDVEVERRILEAAGHGLVAKLATASEEQVDDFYQYLDHRMILLSASIGEPGRVPGFPFRKHPPGTRFSNFYGRHFDGAVSGVISQGIEGSCCG